MSSGRRFLVVGLGELLWDLLPDEKKLGGAPANFAYHSQALGESAYPVSRIGQDDLGQEIGDALSVLSLPGDCVQLDPIHPTGTVQVELDGQGLPTFTISPEVAWDYLEWTPTLRELAGRADAVCFGSLAQRSPRSRATIRRFLEATRKEALRIFDVNLRQSYFSKEVLQGSLAACSIVKLNGDELPVVLEALGLGVAAPGAAGDQAQGCRRLRETFSLELVCLTMGENGSLLVARDKAAHHPGFRVEVADTIGAGDAFTAALCYHYLRGASLGRTNEAANRYGAWVASQVGATPAAAAEVLAAVR